ncbi:MAG: AmmeMemoRadiSam system protein A [Desulfobacteraceae bacterium]|nr:MAG: AmmeMemoRadiSam system protein A [Desulfobacteraceae bacterium]
MKKKKKNTNQNLTQKQGQALVALARHAIRERVTRSAALDEAVVTLLQDKRLQEKQGTFVTLNQNGQLRGCIGTLTATESIVDSVKRNALNAALHDHRFSPISPEEMDSIDIEVSILTDPAPVEYTDGADLLSKLRPGTDGVIIRQGAARATFLPQVWDQLSGPEEFLTHLCLKAGLAGEAWQTSRIEVLIYQVQYFEEKK